MRNNILRFISLVMTVFLISTAAACYDFKSPQLSDELSSSQKSSAESKEDEKISSKPSESSVVSEVKQAESSKKTVSSKPKKSVVNNSSSKQSSAIDDYDEENFYNDITNWQMYDDSGYEDTTSENAPTDNQNHNESAAKINEITSLEDFLQFERSVRSGYSYKDETVSLECDIDLSGIEWRPIGIFGASFKGNFEGNNHTVSNLKITTAKYAFNGSSTAYVGLFGFVEGGEITGLNIENVDININGLSGASWGYIGAVVGYMMDRDNATGIADCKVSGRINVTDNSKSMIIIGGISGGFDARNSPFYLNRIHSTVDITAEGDVFSGGGILGHVILGNHNSTKCYMSDMIYMGSIKGETRMCEIGGFAGVFYTKSNTKIENCFIQLGLGAIRSDLELGLFIADEAFGCESITLTNIYTMGICDGENIEWNLVGRNSSTVYENNCVYTTQLPENVPFDTEIWDLTDLSAPEFRF